MQLLFLNELSLCTMSVNGKKAGLSPFFKIGNPGPGQRGSPSGDYHYTVFFQFMGGIGGFPETFNAGGPIDETTIPGYEGTIVEEFLPKHCLRSTPGTATPGRHPDDPTPPETGGGTSTPPEMGGGGTPTLPPNWH